MIECWLGRQMFDENRLPLSKRSILPPDSESSPSQRHHFRWPSSICCTVAIVWWIEDGSPPVYRPPGTLRAEYGYSSCRPPSECPSSWGLISGPWGLPPEVVASPPPMPP